MIGNVGKNRKKYILLFIVFVMFMILAALAAFGFRFRGSSLIGHPSKVTEVAALPFYQQTDPEWAEDPLGNSRFRMGGSGCLTTCIASVMGEGTPGEWNRFFSDHQVYDEQGNLQWDQLEKAAGVTVIRKSPPVTAGEIEEFLENGICPIVRVRVRGIGSFHYVVIIGSDGQEFLCMDPLEPGEKGVPLSRFGNRVYALRGVY